MTTRAIQQNHGRTDPARGLAGAVVQGLLRAASAWYRRHASRIELESLTLEQLRDVGIDPDAIFRGHDVPGDPWTKTHLMSLR